MTKRELVVRISTETGLSQQQVSLIVQKTLDHITGSLIKGENIEFRDFGVFEVVTQKSRIGRNPKKPGDTVIIPKRRVVKFKPGKEMKARVLKG
jgi:nucleoid DNA-binding protein